MGAFVSTPPPPSLPVAPERAPPKLIADETCSLTAISCLPLSPDLHRAIFLHLPRDELLFVIPRVCKSFRQMADERTPLTRLSLVPRFNRC